MANSTVKKYLVPVLVGGIGLLASATASAIVVGGVDFGSPGIDHIETTTVAETFINGNDQFLLGYGQVTTVNGWSGYAGGQKLYFTFEGYKSANFTAASVDFTGGTVQLFLLPEFNLLNQSSPTNFASIQAGSAWATLSGHADASGYSLQANGTLTGSTLSFGGSGLLDVTGGLPDVVAFLNSNNIFDGVMDFADMALTTSGNNNVLNRNDVTTGCKTGLAASGTWCIAGSADLRGDTVIPEPGTAALVGVALLGLAGLRKRKAS